MSGRGAGRPRQPFAGRRGRLLPGDGPLARVPAVAVFLVVVVVFAVGVVVGGTVGALLLGLLALGVAALLAVTWARLSPAERVVRVLCLAALAAIAVGLATR